MSSSERRILGRTAASLGTESSAAPALRQVIRGTLADRRRPSVAAPAGSPSGLGAVGPGQRPGFPPGSLAPRMPGAGVAAAYPGATPDENGAADLESLRQAAEDQGYAEGLARAERELSVAIDAASAFAAQLESVAPRETTTVAHAIVEVALAVARRVLDVEVSLDPSVLASAIEDAVGLVNGSPEVCIYLNPAAVDAVRLAWEERHGRTHLGKRWLFEADPTLPPGGCVLRHEHGFVDAGLESQLEEIGIALDRAIPTLFRVARPEEAA